MISKKPKPKPSAALWTGITVAFSLCLTLGTIYLFKSGVLSMKPGPPKPVVIHDAEAVPRFNALMDAANTAMAGKDYLSAVTALDQVLALGEVNPKIRAACEQQQVRRHRDEMLRRLSEKAGKK